jgi:transketolase
LSGSGDCRIAISEALLEIAKEDPRVYVLCSDSRGSAAVSAFADTLPGQFVECGIAEQDEVGIAAGLAAMGKKPFVCAPASFLSARALEQVKVDVAYSGQNVKLIGVSGGISYGALGYTHHSTHDIAAMRAIAGIEIYIPSDATQAKSLIHALAGRNAAAYVRVGRGKVPNIYAEGCLFEAGKASLLRDGGDLTIIAAGEMVFHALGAAKLLEQRCGIAARVLDMFTIKPLDEAAILRAAEQTGRIATIEEHSAHGGLGGAVAETVCGSRRAPVPVLIIGLPDEPAVAGKSGDVFAHYAMDGEGAARRIEAWLRA